MSYVQPIVIKVQVVFERDIFIKDYTAKLVKSLLISGNPRLEEVFARGKNLPPKPIHITPLYTTSLSKDGKKKRETVYTKYIPKDSTAKPPKVSRLRPVRIETGKTYFFYIGTNLSLLSDVLLGLSNIGKFVFGKWVVDVENISYEIHYIDLEKESEEITNILLKNIGRNNKERLQVKIVFESPTLLKDPLAIMRKKKKKLLLPLPEAIFSVPMFMMLIDKGRFRSSVFLRCMRYLKSVFDIPYTVLKTVNLVWYVYDNEVLPAMIGYVKYFVDNQILQYVQSITKMKYNLDFMEILSKSIILAQVYGVGDGRATGFGHITIKMNTIQR